MTEGTSKNTPKSRAYSDNKQLRKGSDRLNNLPKVIQSIGRGRIQTLVGQVQSQCSFHALSCHELFIGQGREVGVYPIRSE